MLKTGVSVACVLLLSACQSLLVMEDYSYQVSSDDTKWNCKSKWVGVINSFPSGRQDYCEEVE